MSSSAIAVGLLIRVTVALKMQLLPLSRASTVPIVGAIDNEYELSQRSNSTTSLVAGRS